MSIAISTYDLSNWKIAQIKGRVDAFNDKRILKVIEDLVDQNSASDVSLNYAVDLSDVDFLSFIAIQGLLKIAQAQFRKKREFVLLAPNAQVRRHIESFAGNKGIRIFRNLDELKTGLFFRPRSEYLSAESVSQRNLI